MVFGYFDLYLVPFNTIKSDITSEQKIVNNLVNKHIVILKARSLTQDE